MEKKTVLSKSQVANLYGITVKTLMSWIKLNAGLQKKLENLGYRKRAKSFSIKQLELITEHLGEY